MGDDNADYSFSDTSSYIREDEPYETVKEEEKKGYGYFVFSIFVFNLIVGIGAMYMPYGFQQAGLITGVVMLLFVGFLAFICVTYIVEAMSHSNALLAIASSESSLNSTDPLLPAKRGILRDYSIDEGDYSSIPLSPAVAPAVQKNPYRITKRVELGEMSEMFLGKVGYYCFYAILVIYLYGDLAIYGASVPISLNTMISPNGFHFWGMDIGPAYTYRIWLLLFALVVVPVCYFDFQNTKYLQFITVVCRNLAFVIMIVVTLIIICKGEGTKISEVNWFHAAGIPTLFGTTVYAFMCHHSIPGMVAPLNEKKFVTHTLVADYIVVFGFYALLNVTAIFAFPSGVKSLYSLNFQDQGPFVDYYLGLFPVFTLTTNFPLISITLRNNLIKLCSPIWKSESRVKMSLVYSTIAAIPGLVIAFFTQNVSVLVAYTGGYAGLGIMLVIPPILVYYSRKKMSQTIPDLQNPNASPFHHVAWSIFVLVSASIALLLTTVNLGIDTACDFDSTLSVCGTSN